MRPDVSMNGLHINQGNFLGIFTLSTTLGYEGGVSTSFRSKRTNQNYNKP